MTSIYRYLDYRVALNGVLKERRKVNPKFTASRLAEAIGVQKPYVSRVLKTDAHFNADQLFAAGKFLELTDTEYRYLEILLEWQRSVVTERRRELRAKIRDVQDQSRGTEKHLDVPMLNPKTDDADYAEYYLEPHAQLVHGFLIVPKYSRDPKQIARILGLTTKKLERILQTLVRLKLIEFNGARNAYRVLKESTHLHRDSVFAQAYQLLFRQAASEHVKTIDESEKFLFTVTLSADEETRTFIRDEFNEFLKKIEPRVREAPAESVYQMSFDLFRWDAE